MQGRSSQGDVSGLRWAIKVVCMKQRASDMTNRDHTHCTQTSSRLSLHRAGFFRICLCVCICLCACACAFVYVCYPYAAIIHKIALLATKAESDRKEAQTREETLRAKVTAFHLAEAIILAPSLCIYCVLPVPSFRRILMY